MNKKATFIILALSATVGIATALQSQRWPVFSTPASNTKTQAAGTIQEQALYPVLEEEELFGRADLVFEGQVIGFSPSFWNRDNNGSPASVQEWESTPSHIHHQVQLKVTKPILGVHVGQVVNVTKSGPSPIQSTVKMSQGYTFYAKSDSNLIKVGSKGIFLLSTKAKALWISASGKMRLKAITGFAAPLFQSYLPEKNGRYDLAGEPATLDLIQRKVRLYEPARGKQLQEIEERYRMVEKQLGLYNKN